MVLLNVSDNVKEKKKKILIYLNELLARINESEKDDVEQIYKMVGNKLKEIDISFLVTIIDSKKESLIFKYFSSSKENEEVFKKIIFQISDRGRILIADSYSYREMIISKKASFVEKKLQNLLKRFPNIEPSVKQINDVNSVICPMVLKGETVGFLEFSSTYFDVGYIELFENFSKNFVNYIASTILYQQAKKTEEKYYDIFENANLGFYIINGAKKKFVEVNKGLCNITEYTKDELLQMNYITIFSQKERKKINDFVKARLTNKEDEVEAPLNYETKIKTKFGKEKNIQVTILRIITENEWFVEIEDISGRKKIEEALKKSEQSLMEAQKILRLGNWNLYISKNILDWSDEVYNIFEIDRSKDIDYDLFIKMVHPDDRGYVKQSINAALYNKQAYNIDHRIITRGGEKTVNVKAKVVFDSKGNPSKMIGTILDITDRKKAEEELLESEKKYRMIFDNIADAVFHIDAETFNILDTNKAASSIYGYTNQEFLKMNAIDLSDEKKITLRHLRGVLEDENTVSPVRRHLKKDKTVIKVEISASTFSWKGRKTIGTIVRDITQREKAAEQIKHNHRSQLLINKLLNLSLQDYPLQDFLDKIIFLLANEQLLSASGSGGIWLADEKHPKKLFLASSVGMHSELKKSCKVIPFGKCVCGRAAQNKKFEYINSTHKSHEIKHKHLKEHGHYCMPVISKDKVLGIVNLYINKNHSYSEKEANLFSTLSSILATLIERTLAKEELAKSEEKYRVLFENANDIVMLINRDAQIEYVNNIFYKISGYSKNEALKMRVDEFVHPDDRKMVKSKFQELFKKGELPKNYEFRAIKKDKQEFYVSFSGVAIYKKAKITGVQAILRDVTESKKLQETIESAKKHYEEVIDTIEDSICVIDKNFEVVSFNKVFSEKVKMNFRSIKGTAANLVLQKYEHNLFNNVKEANKFDGEKCGFLDSVFNTAKSKTIERVLEIKKEKYFYKIKVLPSLNAKQEVYQVVLAIADVSKDKKAEEQIRKLDEFKKRILDNSPVSIIVLDKAGKMISLNAVAEKLMSKKMIGTKLVMTTEINKKKELKILYKKLLEEGKSFYFDNLPYILVSNKQTRYFNIIATPLYDDRGNVDGAISMALDNTDAVVAKRKLEDLNRKLEIKVVQRTRELALINKKLNNVLELKSKFISDASHELRTPLTVMQGNLDLEVRYLKSKNKRLPEIYEIVGKEIKQISKILADLTMLTNADSNAEAVLYEDVDLMSVASAGVQSLKILAEKKKIKMKTELEKIVVKGDETKLEKLLLNILRNAIKYTEDGGSIKVKLSRINNEAMLSVEDDGIGIPKKDIPYIFERFYRVDKARTRKIGGTGLGLAICKWIVEAHCGRIEVASEEGKGSTFTICIPLDYKTKITEESLF